MSGQDLICLQDPLNISEKSLFILLPLLHRLLISTVSTPPSIFKRIHETSFGGFLFSEKIQEIIGPTRRKPLSGRRPIQRSDETEGQKPSGIPQSEKPSLLEKLRGRS